MRCDVASLTPQMLTAADLWMHCHSRSREHEQVRKQFLMGDETACFLLRLLNCERKELLLLQAWNACEVISPSERSSQ